MLQSDVIKTGYREWMIKIWREKGLFEITETWFQDKNRKASGVKVEEKNKKTRQIH